MSDINIGQFSEALNDKADRDLMNVDTTGGADAIVEYQLPTAANDYKWYRKYASGWIEQGGMVTGQADATNKTVTYPLTFSTMVCDYNIHNTRGSGAEQYAFQIGVTANPGLSQMTIRTVCNGTTNYVWSVKGY